MAKGSGGGGRGGGRGNTQARVPTSVRQQNFVRMVRNAAARGGLEVSRFGGRTFFRPASGGVYKTSNRFANEYLSDIVG